MEQQTLSVVNSFLNAVQTLNMEVIGQLLHPDIVWNQQGAHRFGGIKRSNTEVFQMVGGMMQDTNGSLTLAGVKDMAVNGNQASCVLHWKAQKDGQQLDTYNVDIYTVKEGKIVAATIFVTDPEGEQRFWGN